MQITLAQAPRTARVPRRPQHRFWLKQRPWQLQPFMIAPVLPGETMKNLLLQTRVVSDPVKSPLIGWWCEYYFFYVKHRDLDNRDDFTEMMLDPNKSLAAHRQATYDVKKYTPKNGIKWVEYCLNRVRDEYFRDEDEVGTSFDIDGLPAVQISMDGFHDSVTLGAKFTTTNYDVNVDLNANAVVTASEVERAMRTWQMLRQAGVTEMSYEDYLRSFGLNIPETEEPHTPELVRYVREWTYPSNTVDPVTGAPSSALSWSVAERADKDRFFKEPGFLFGVSCIRPKVYLSNQKGCAAAILDHAFAWLPAMYREDLGISWRNIATGNGPFENVTDTAGYWIDVRDLFVHGDQFVNVDVATSTEFLKAALPTAALQRRFPVLTDAQALFVDGGGAGTAQFVRQDGVVSLNILGTQTDTSPQGTTL